MNGISLLIACVIFSFLPQPHPQENPTHVCVVQVKEGFAGTDTNQERGMDAVGLITSLTQLTTKNGLPIRATSIRQMPRKEVDDEVDKQQCDYVVELWRHISPDDAGGGNVGAYRVEPTGDRDMVEYQLRKAGTRKVLASGSAPPATLHGKTHWRTTPYPIFAKEIVKRIDR